jgi:nitrate reductase gamma subunit
MQIIFGLVIVSLLALLAYLGTGVGSLGVLFGVVIPYGAVALFVGGMLWRLWRWASTPVPFRITTTCGQQKTLPWIKSSTLDNPSTGFGVVLRMALEILLFRSLFRNTRAEMKEGPRLTYGEEKYLWLGALVFHWSFLIIVLRHFRFFLEPVPACVGFLAWADGFFQMAIPVLYLTDVAFMGALAFLLFRRLADARLRYISLLADYMALFLLLAVGLSGVLMRYFLRVDVVEVKQWALGLSGLHPVVPAGLGPDFFIHLFLVSCLIAILPFTKMSHMAGVFLSPTRNLANDNRMRRHVNPWNYPVNVHTYEEWEHEFKDKIIAAGLPLEGK